MSLILPFGHFFLFRISFQSALLIVSRKVEDAVTKFLPVLTHTFSPDPQNRLKALDTVDREQWRAVYGKQNVVRNGSL